MKEILMSKGAKKILDVNIKLKEGESLLIITEIGMENMAKVIAKEAYLIGAEPVISIILPRETDGAEPPKMIAESMKESSAFICLVQKSITHTHAVRNAVNSGSRGIMLTQFTEDMLISGGINADFETIKPLCIKISKILENADNVHLTTIHGTDLKFSAKGRRGNALYDIVEKGEFSPLPTIEANVSPLEGTAEGIIVADASIPYIGIGLLDEHISFTVNKGMIVDIKGGKQAEILKNDLLSKDDPMVYNIAELGIGLNPECKFIGLMLEDEGVYGSVHIGIGSNLTLGGNIKAACHYDLIMTGATLVADGVKIIDNGEVIINEY